MAKGWHDWPKGVEVKANDFSHDVTICYHGLLAKSGADEVYLHYGFGDRWLDTHTEKMHRTPDGWEKNIKIKYDQLNFCFKDSANNWDNNSGYNWIVR